MRRTFALTLAALLTLGLVAGAALAQGPGSGQGHGPPPFAAADVTILSSGDHESPSPGSGYGDLENNGVDSLDLGEGDWKITASGAIDVADSPLAPNCGLVVDDDGELTLIGKQNFADGSFVGRSGFAVTGAVTVEGEAEVHLVCYGAGNDPFEHNLVAIGAS